MYESRHFKFYLIIMYMQVLTKGHFRNLILMFNILQYWIHSLNLMLSGTFHTLTYYKIHGLVSTLFTINQIPLGSYDKLGRILHAFLSLHPCWWKVQIENIFITFYYEFWTFYCQIRCIVCTLRTYFTFISWPWEVMLLLLKM